MEKTLNDITNLFGYNEPILSPELRSAFDISRPEFNILVNKLLEDGTLFRLQRGVYVVPNEQTDLNNLVPFGERVIEKKYIRDKEETFGYYTGLHLANSLGLTKETEEIPKVVTNLCELSLEQAKPILLNHLDGQDYFKAEIKISLRYYKGTARTCAKKIGLLT